MPRCHVGHRIILISFSFFLLSTASSQPYAIINPQQTSPTCDVPGVVYDYDTTNPKYHKYPTPVQTTICSKSNCANCSTENVLATMLGNRSLTAPTLEVSPVDKNTCSTGNVYLEIPPGGYVDSMGIQRDGVVIPNNPIASVVTDSGIVNYTLPGHMLHPGKVIRTIKELERDGETFIVVETTGEGTGNFGTLNNYFRYNLWIEIDVALAFALTCEQLDISGDYEGGATNLADELTKNFVRIRGSGETFTMQFGLGRGAFAGPVYSCTFVSSILDCDFRYSDDPPVSLFYKGVADGATWKGDLTLVFNNIREKQGTFSYTKYAELPE